MFRFLLCTLVVSATALSGAVPQGQPWIDVEDAKGSAVMGFAARDKPFDANVSPAVDEWFNASNVVDKSGRVVSALLYYGWKAGATTTVIVLGEVPVEGAPNQVFPEGSRQLKRIELARYQLGAGAAQKVDVLGTSLVRTLRVTLR